MLYTFWDIVIYPATDVPYWKKGAIIMDIVCFAYVAVAFGVKRVSSLNHLLRTGSHADAIVA